MGQALGSHLAPLRSRQVAWLRSPRGPPEPWGHRVHPEISLFLVPKSMDFHNEESGFLEKKDVDLTIAKLGHRQLMMSICLFFY